MERLDAPVHDLGEAGVVVDGADRDSCAGELLGRAAGRDDLDTELGKAPGELGYPALVRDRQQGALDLDGARGDRVRGACRDRGVVRCGDLPRIPTAPKLLAPVA
jgi:hypothetical protein